MRWLVRPNIPRARRELERVRRLQDTPDRRAPAIETDARGARLALALVPELVDHPRERELDRLELEHLAADEAETELPGDFFTIGTDPTIEELAK